MINVLYIHQDGLITGSAISLMQMLKGFEPTAVKPTVLFFSNGPAVDWFKNEGIKTVVVKGYPFWTTPGPKWFKIGALLNARALLPNPKLKRVIAEIDPDIVHINDKAALSAGVEAKKLGIPIIQHSRSTYYVCNIALYKHLSAFIINNYSSHIISISEDETFLLGKHKTSIIYNSISLNDVKDAIEHKIKLDDTLIHIGWVGKFTSSKGAWDFLEIASRVHKKYPNLKFHMLAALPTETQTDYIDGKQVYSLSHLEHLIKTYDLSSVLTLHGYRNDFLRVMASFDIIINCNRLGAFGRQAFESLALGLPSVATCLSPGKSSILNSTVAVICKEGDLDNIFQEVVQLIEDKNKRKLLAQRALAWGHEQFDPIKQSDKILNIYTQFIHANTYTHSRKN